MLRMSKAYQQFCYSSYLFGLIVFIGILLGWGQIARKIHAQQLAPSPVGAQASVVNATTIGFTFLSFGVLETDGNAVISVTLDAPSSQIIKVNYATSDNTASASSDYTAVAGTLTFNPGEVEKTLVVPIINDNVTEGNETLSLTLSNPTNAVLDAHNQASLTIIDDEGPVSIQFSPDIYMVDEGYAAGGIISVKLNRPALSTVTVNYATSDKSATGGIDYTSANGTLTFAPGETSKTFSIFIVDDNIDEPDEIIDLVLSAPTGGVLGSPGDKATLTIKDNDPAPTLQFSQANYSISENGGSATIVVNVSAPSARVITVDYATSNDTALAGSDYTAAAGTFTFAPGETSREFSVQIINDSLNEANEALKLTLTNAVNATLGVPANATLTIVDDDPLTPTPTATNPLLATATLTPTPTATNPPAATPTNTPTFTATFTPTPPASGDDYEPDNQCDQAHLINIDGSVQKHQFDQQADVDWVRFDAVTGKRYLIAVDIPPDSLADVALELYPGCSSVSTGNQDYSFTPGIHLVFSTTVTGPISLKFVNNDPEVAGAHASYELSVRDLSVTTRPGALILVAGAIRSNDPVQPNIYHVTDAVRQVFIDHGYTDDNIDYLAPDLQHAHVDGLATTANLEAAITNWAADKLGSDGALTLYLMDHGAKALFYLDKRRSEWMDPGQLNTWLTALETTHPGLKVNLIIEACYSGSFIGAPQSLSKQGRVVITSTDNQNVAWASNEGALFSDHFLDGLRRGESLYSSFREAQIATQIAHPDQNAWLDADGNNQPQQVTDQLVAAQRGFAFAGTLADVLWPPYIAKVELPLKIENRRGQIRANVRDDVRVTDVWAVIYPPSYVAPINSEALVQEPLQTVKLIEQGHDWYAATYSGFDEIGVYRIVVYATDGDELNARPVAIEVNTGNQVLLPVIQR